VEDFGVSENDPHQENREPRLGRSVSLEHAARLLRVSRRTIYNRIRDGRLQTIRTLGGSQRVLVESLYGVELRSPDVSNLAVTDAAPASVGRT
jgi:excisionase family DNA binding protein